MRFSTALLGLAVLMRTQSAWSRCLEPRDCNPTSITPAEICDFHKVDSELYRGGRPTCAGLAKLEGLGVRTFIDLGGAAAAIRHCKAEAASRGMHFIRFKISLLQILFMGVTDRQLRDLFATIQDAPKPIYVSCSLGRDRTGMVVALYRMRRGEMSFAEARREAIHYGYRPRFRGLRVALNRYRDASKVRQLPAPSPRPPQSGTACQPAL